MSLRREQVLLIVVVLLGVWVWSGTSAAEPRPKRIAPAERELAATPTPGDPLVAPLADIAALSRDPFREPSETLPLAPRPLDFPPRSELPVLSLPLAPGPLPGAFDTLRVAGTPVAFQFADGGAGEPGGGAAPVAPDNNDSSLDSTESLDQYDKIIRTNAPPIWGYVRSEDKYELDGSRPTKTIDFDMISVKTGQVIATMPLEPGDVQSIELAKTLRNRIELRRRRLGTGKASLQQRREFIVDLLEEARRQVWVYEIAEEQADEYLRISDNDIEGYRLKLRVLYHNGRLDAVWELIEKLKADPPNRAFLAATLGEFEARLTLDAEAEAHLREARELEGGNPYYRAALARFLLQRNRPAEALEHAEAARRAATLFSADEDRFEAAAMVVAAHLALGQTAAAADALRGLPTGEGLGARRDYLAGAVHYAKGERDAARTRFESAIAASAMDRAALAMAACQLLEGQWQEARAGFTAVADRAPLLRDRAHAGLGLLYERTGNIDQALPQLEAAQRANPRSAYTLYLLGRTRRLAAQYDSAVEVLGEALNQSDDLIEALAEITAAYLAIAERSGSNSAELLYNATRYADRLVELDTMRNGTPDTAFLELQGLARFRGGDLRKARESFAAGAERSNFCRIGVALVDYGQGRTARARALLKDLLDQLRTGHPLRPYVEDTIAKIDDHAQKEQLLDNFERDELGENWQVERNGSAGPTIKGGTMHITGSMRAQGKPVRVTRMQDVAGDFLRAEVTIGVGPGHEARDAVLHVATVRRRGSGSGNEFSARLGFRDKKPFLIIKDGDVSSASDDEERRKWDPVDLGGLDYRAGEPARVALDVVPRGDDGRRFTLRAFWNDQLIHEREIQRLNRRSKAQLPVEFLVQGSSMGAQVDVTFDEFRLVRRKENP